MLTKAEVLFESFLVHSLEISAFFDIQSLEVEGSQTSADVCSASLTATVFWVPIHRCLPSEEHLGEHGARLSSKLERPGGSVHV